MSFVSVDYLKRLYLLAGCDWEFMNYNLHNTILFHPAWFSKDPCITSLKDSSEKLNSTFFNDTLTVNSCSRGQ